MTGSRFPFTKQIFTLLTVVIAFGFAAAASQSATLSGRVINTKGDPIAEAAIVLLYVKVGENGAIDTLDDRSRYPFLRQEPAHRRHLPPDTDEAEREMPPPFLKSETDAEGRFTFTDIATEMAQLMVLPKEDEQAAPVPQNLKPAPEIQFIRFGQVKFQPHDFSFFPLIGAVTYTVKPGSDIKDVEVVIETQPKSKIQGRLVFKNGEPLADTLVEMNIGHFSLDWGGSAFSRSLQTDADGNFVPDMFSPGGTYVLSVSYRGLSAMSAPFNVEAGKPHEKVVLTLNGNPTDLSASPTERPKKQRYGVPDVPGVWIVNPANEHAYKWIVCEDWEDAQTKAADDEAHLVTITSEAEQIWLEAIFGRGPYWIGLTDVLKEGEWIWETGEPVTYTNWGKKDEGIDLYEPPALLKPFIHEDDVRREVMGEEENYVIMSSRWDEEIGKWYPSSLEGAGHRGRAFMAILEKDGMRSKVHGLSLPDEE